jgi:hypothetical protein
VTDRLENPWQPAAEPHPATAPRKSSNYYKNLTREKIPKNRGIDRRCYYGAEPIASPPYVAALIYGPVRESGLQ